MSLSAGFNGTLPEVSQAGEYITLNLAGPSVLKGRDSEQLPQTTAQDAGKSLVVGNDGGFALKRRGGIRRESRVIDGELGGMGDSFYTFGINFYCRKNAVIDGVMQPVLPENCLILGIDINVDGEHTFALRPSSDDGLDYVFIANSPVPIVDGEDDYYLLAVIKSDFTATLEGLDSYMWQSYTVHYLTWSEDEE